MWINLGWVLISILSSHITKYKLVKFIKNWSICVCSFYGLQVLWHSIFLLTHAVLLSSHIFTFPLSSDLYDPEGDMERKWVFSKKSWEGVVQLFLNLSINYFYYKKIASNLIAVHSLMCQHCFHECGTAQPHVCLFSYFIAIILMHEGYSSISNTIVLYMCISAKVWGFLILGQAQNFPAADAATASDPAC